MPAGNRSWCFTLNNPTPNEATTLPLPNGDSWPHQKLLVYQLERGERGTPHIQGYVQFDCQRSLASVKRLLPRAHWEVAKGTPQQNLAYCTKEGRLLEPVIIGEFPVGGGGPGASSHNGKGLSRAGVCKLIQDNPHITEAEIIDQGGLHILCAQPSILGIARGYLLGNARRNGVTCELFHGAPGTGKSRLADTLYPNAYRKAPGPWWDMYAGEGVVIFDDFDESSLELGEFLRVIDRYPHAVPVKGSYVKLVATHFVITSNLLPNQWWTKALPERIAAVHRRIGHVIHFDAWGKPKLFNGPDFLDYKMAHLGQDYTLPWEVDSPDSSQSTISLEGWEATQEADPEPDDPVGSPMLFDLDLDPEEEDSPPLYDEDE